VKQGWAAALVGVCLFVPGITAAQPEARQGPAADARGEVIVIDVDGAIGPASSAYVEAAVGEAEDRGASLVILRMDTPGGLDTSIRSIVKAVIASAVPVVGYVAPSGARAASAGTYILYACHLAAMAPGTNLGAATPVELGGLPRGSPEKPKPDGETGPKPSGDAIRDKVVNDAAAYIRSLAQMRGRNADWAESAVREAASLPAEEAVRLGVVDLLARDVDDLLHQIDGRIAKTAAGEVTLATGGLTLVELAPDWHSLLLAVIGNPNIAYILMLVGIYGLIYEFANPGTVLPGTVGAVSLVLALYAFQLLPINFAGVALMALGLGLMVAEAFAPAFGALGLGGVAAFVVGSLILIDSNAPGFGVSIPLILAVAAISAVLLFLIVTLAVKAHRRPVVSGSEELIGAVGQALSGFPGSGTVRVHGEVWAARSAISIVAGTPVTVTGRDRLTVLVEPTLPDKGA
jgi:membrane-bound serine protease (ClpP class)